ncbi:MAG: glycosyl transferase family 1, partial [Pseudomonadota bacterium]
MSPPVIAFFPEASFGAALNCVGIAQKLAQQGATPVFLCHPGFDGIFAEYGFREYRLPAEVSNGPTGEDSWQTFIETHLEHFDQPPVEQLETYVGPTWDAIVDTVMRAEAGLHRLLAQIRPDAIVLDNVIMFPAIANAGVPWVRFVSCAETEVPDPAVPPYLSGLSADDPDRGAFENKYLTVTQAAHARYNRFRVQCGLSELPA